MTGCGLLDQYEKNPKICIFLPIIMSYSCVIYDDEEDRVDICDDDDVDAFYLAVKSRLEAN